MQHLHTREDFQSRSIETSQDAKELNAQSFSETERLNSGLLSDGNPHRLSTDKDPARGKVSLVMYSGETCYRIVIVD